MGFVYFNKQDKSCCHEYCILYDYMLSFAVKTNESVLIESQ